MTATTFKLPLLPSFILLPFTFCAIFDGSGDFTLRERQNSRVRVEISAFDADMKRRKLASK